jgi:3-hydroxybutyryl-CoA dehydratase
MSFPDFIDSQGVAKILGRLDNSVKSFGKELKFARVNMNQTMPLGFEELQLGDSWLSASRIITEDDIQQFADLTGDRDPLHTDPVFAADGPFGKPIAHGLLGISFLAGLSSVAPRVLTSAFVSIRSWAFTKPVFIGDRVHVATEVLDLKPHGRRHGEVHWHRKLVNQDGQTVQEGIFVTLVSRKVPLSLQRSRIGEMSRGAEPQMADPSTREPVGT